MITGTLQEHELLIYINLSALNINPNALHSQNLLEIRRRRPENTILPVFESTLCMHLEYSVQF